MFSTLPFQCYRPQLAARWWEVLRAVCLYLDVSPHALKQSSSPETSDTGTLPGRSRLRAPFGEPTGHHLSDLCSSVIGKR
jgi:hypothetical protein